MAGSAAPRISRVYARHAAVFAATARTYPGEPTARAEGSLTGRSRDEFRTGSPGPAPATPAKWPASTTA
ncbi:hypothetical protein ABZ734_27330 [Streptomyces sp. NPDC006660]|uniref:hypothetical protein n=1 Tax=Streptomyces sp. NPDC006660 TaxID=3156901 RepID=UPI0033D972AF